MDQQIQQLFLGPIFGIAGGWLGAAPYRNVVMQRIGLAVGATLSLLVSNLGVGSKFPYPWWLAGWPSSAITSFLLSLVATLGAGVLLKRSTRSTSTAQTLPARRGYSIFISYRRLDSLDVTGRIYDRLIQRYGNKNIIRDLDSIPPGTNFREYIESTLRECAVSLIIIGSSWTTVKSGSGYTLHDAEDLVRQEVEYSLSAGGPFTIPILVGGASMPLKTELPPSINSLSDINSFSVRSDPDFHRDVDRLLVAIDSHLLSKGPAIP